MENLAVSTNKFILQHIITAPLENRIKEVCNLRGVQYNPRILEDLKTWKAEFSLAFGSGKIRYSHLKISCVESFLILPNYILAIAKVITLPEELRNLDERKKWLKNFKRILKTVEKKHSREYDWTQTVRKVWALRT